jgi:hypothetical protein
MGWLGKLLESKAGEGVEDEGAGLTEAACEVTNDGSEGEVGSRIENVVRDSD